MGQPEGTSRTTVAIIGSGMAGLVSAYLLKQDQSQNFDVQVFEMQNELSLDSASVTVPSANGREVRIDLPMRAFAGGYYSNLRRMYNYLGVKYTPMQFLFPLSRAPVVRDRSNLPSPPNQGDADDHVHSDERDGKFLSSKPYFIHSSNNHRIPPIRPEHLGLWDWVAESIYLVFCFAWYTICSFFIPPYSSRTDYRSATGAGISKQDSVSVSESLGEYLQRIRLPTYFTQNYILPQFSAVTTCSHEALLKFPAKDFTDYATQTYNVPYYVVKGGVNIVQKKLAEGLNIQLSSRVVSVELLSGSSKVRVSYMSNTDGTIHQRDFNHVIMAVTPDVVGAIFQPLRSAMAQVPTIKVESVVHNDTSSLRILSQTSVGSEGYFHPSSAETQVIHVRSSPAGFTEAIHECTASLLVTTGPITPIDTSKVIHRTSFTRVLRTPQSREVVNRIFGYNPITCRASEKCTTQWRNGYGNVWLVGGWCWDGMVLLEGCVVSAMRVADALGVHVPWRDMV
ncbi:hypothetical protein PABG_12109 [Paracoccidioides brasiliensis Pb03]|nr:hypothetical protein PABG_12109 [Paracoccidioides brasiliensis Pb03]